MPYLPAWMPPTVDATALVQSRFALARTLIEARYPRINVLLFDDAHPLPHAVLNVRIEPTLRYAGLPAYAEGNTMYLLSSYIEQQDEKDFTGMVIHELTHINQAAHHIGADGWVVEGVADYVRHKYFAGDIDATLNIDADGRLHGYLKDDGFLYGLQVQKTDLRTRGYEAKYVVAATFLYWLELHKNARIVHEISVAFEQGKYTPQLFTQTCGKPLDALWREFVDASIHSDSSSK